MYERDPAEVDNKMDTKLSQDLNAAKCRKYRDNRMTKKLRNEREEIKLQNKELEGKYNSLSHKYK